MGATMIYECHITVAVRDAGAAQRLADLYGWKTSEIKRDPVLGDDSYFYLTQHSTKREDIFSRMHTMNFDLDEAGVPVIRSKIEHIVYDTKTGIGV